MQVNDKLRGIADPFDMGQYVFQPFENVAGNYARALRRASKHSLTPVNPALQYPDPSAVQAGAEHRFAQLPGPNLYLSPKDWSVPAAGQYATYPADPVLAAELDGTCRGRETSSRRASGSITASDRVSCTRVPAFHHLLQGHQPDYCFHSHLKSAFFPFFCHPRRSRSTVVTNEPGRETDREVLSLGVRTR